MIAGHGFLAFALAGWVARALGEPPRRALEVGLLALGFALLPDVDIVHAFVGLFDSAPSDPLRANEVFWSASRELHRGITHSLLIGVPAAFGFGLLRTTGAWRAVGLGLLGAVLALATTLGGLVGFALTGLFVLAGVGVVFVAREFEVGTAGTILAGAIGLLTHPFGDVFTGTPPDMLYPLRAGPLSDRIVLVGDPTLNLLAVFGVELSTVWLAVVVAFGLVGLSIAEYVHPAAVLGLGYGGAALVLPAPSIDVAAPFVFTALSVGVVGVVPLFERLDRGALVRGALTGISAVSLGGLSYAAVYALA